MGEKIWCGSLCVGVEKLSIGKGSDPYGGSKPWSCKNRAKLKQWQRQHPKLLHVNRLARNQPHLNHEQTSRPNTKRTLNMPCHGNKRKQIYTLQTARKTAIRPVTSKKMQTFPEIAGNHGKNIYPRSRLNRRALYSILSA